MLLQSLANLPTSAHVLQVDMCRSTCGLHRWKCALDTSHVAISNGPSPSAWLPSSCPVIIVDTSIFNPSDGGMGENMSSGPSCLSLSLVLLIYRQTNLERQKRRGKERKGEEQRGTEGKRGEERVGREEEEEEGRGMAQDGGRSAARKSVGARAIEGVGPIR